MPGIMKENYHQMLLRSLIQTHQNENLILKYSQKKLLVETVYLINIYLFWTNLPTT